MSDHIKYRGGYKYQLAEPHIEKIALLPAEHIAHSDYIVLSVDGDLIINAGYAWDGCSGPTWDDKTNMRGGLVHDALYQLMREGLLPQDHREMADNELYRLCREDGMNVVRAWTYLKGVRLFAASAAKLGTCPYPILEAP